MIALRDPTVSYGARLALRGVSADLAAGSLTAVVGPNGAGKSTLLKTIAGAIRPKSGSIDLRAEGRPAPLTDPARHVPDRPWRGRSPAARVAYLPQQAEIDRGFPIRVRDLVAMGLWAEIGAFRRVTSAQNARVDAALAAVGLVDLARRGIAELSGGQMQRVLFARLLLQDAAVILLDEPFAAVDERTTADLLAIVRRWHAEGRTVVAVLHDLDTVRRVFPDVLVLAGELVAHGPSARVLTEDTLRRARHLAATEEVRAA